MKTTAEISNCRLNFWRTKRAGYFAGASVLGLLMYVGAFVYANDSERREGQPEILASTLKFYPAGWQILAINPDTGEFRNVSNRLSADN
jgi:hypothetical protein